MQVRSAPPGSSGEDAAKCCNGFRRVLVFNDPKSCDSVVLELLPGGVSYGYRWVPI
ncbi:MAG: hypothetical protein J5U17_12355 [Candidatus Methanoperedens sp.]|nr:hypothetical protein [Candidatus Methanoperedens sp.]MCE8428873.1 hypothetical protein [Candidatus Methanoperedens sp.]